MTTGLTLGKFEARGGHEKTGYTDAIIDAHERFLGSLLDGRRSGAASVAAAPEGVL